MAGEPADLTSHNSVWIAIRQRYQKHGVHYAENCRISADAEGKREQDDRSEAGGLAEHADGEAQILPQCFYKKFSAGRANDFLGNFETSALQAHRAKRILAAPPLSSFFGCHPQEAV